jgi:WG containing repeat
MKTILQACLIFLTIFFGSCSKNDHRVALPDVPVLYPIKENSLFGYMDVNGTVVIPPTFEYASDFKDGMGRILSKGKFGFVNEKGEVVIKPEFAFADDFRDGFARVNTTDTTILDGHYDGYSLNANWTFVNKKGVVFTETFAKAEYLKAGYAQVKDNPSYDAPWIYATLTEGKLTREERSTEAIFNYNGHDTAPASDQGTMKVGTINKREEWVIEPTFDAIEPFSESRAAAKKGNQFGYINRDGAWIYQQVVSINDYYYLNTDFKPFSNGLAAVKLDKDNFGYIKADGTIAFKQKFKEAGSFNSEGYAIVSNESGSGLIDKDGKFVIKPNLDIVDARGDIAIFKTGSSVGARSIKSGKEIVAPEFDNIEVVGNLLRLTRKGATYGFVNKEGEFAIKPQYDMAWAFKNGRAIVQQKEKFLYIDNSGKVIGNVPAEHQPYYYQNAENFFVSQDNGKFGYMKPGQDGFVIPATYDFATDFEDAVGRVNTGATLNQESWSYEGGKWGLVDTRGTAVLPATFELILPFNQNKIAVYNSGGDASYAMCEVECMEPVSYSCIGGRWGLMSADGKTITEAEYASLIPFGSNFLAAIDSTFAIINGDGTEIYPMKLAITVVAGEEGAIADYRMLKFIKATEDGRTGVIDVNGKWLQPPQYDDVQYPASATETPFNEGMLLVKSGDRWGAVNVNGDLIIPAEYDEMRPFSGNYAAIRTDSKWGFIDRNNNVIIQPEYFNVRDFQGAVAIVQSKEESPESVINSKGETIIKPLAGVTFDYNGFSHGLCIIRGTEETEGVGYPVSTTGVVNDKGRIIFNKSELTDARINEGGIVYAIKNNKWAMANSDGVMLTGYNYSWIEPFTGQALIRCNTGGEIQYDEYGNGEECFGGRWGFIDKNGKMKVALKFSELGPFQGGFAAARTSADLDQIGYVDFNGKSVRELKR